MSAAAMEQEGPEDGTSRAPARRRVRVAHLTSVHREMDTRILHRECSALAAAGFDVTVVAAWPGSDVGDDILLRSVPRLRGKWRRVSRTLPLIARIAMRSKHDIYHLHDPELLPVGFALRLRGRRVVYDAHEDLPEQIRAKEWIPAPLRGCVARMAAVATWAAGRSFSGIVTATEKIGRSFPPARTCVVQNFPRRDELFDPAARPYEARDPVVAYVGDLTVIRGVREATRAMAALPAALDAKLRLAGLFNPASLEAEVATLSGWNRVEWLGWQDRTGVKAVLAEARVGLVALHPVRNYREAQPVKLFEYMIAGLPVVASDFLEWRRFLDDGRAGLMVDPLDVDAIAGAIEWLLTHPDEAEEMGRRGRDLVTRRFSWEAEAEKLVSFYDHILDA